MNTTTLRSRQAGPPVGSAPDDGRLPARPRRGYLNRWSLILTAAAACAAGFYGGVRIEKGQLAMSSTAAGAGPSALAGRFRAPGAGPGAGATAGAGGGATAGAPAGASGSAARPGGFTPGPGAAAGPGGGGSFGTIASVRGKAVYVTDSSGNTVKVRLSSATKITKSLGVSRSSLHPGDTVIIRGAANSSGTLVAATVSDSGAATRASGSGSSGASGGGGGLGSLFSAGG
jgi:hypothetical protein